MPDEIFNDRFRLLKCQMERLKWMGETYDMSYKQLADYYGISKSAAYYICNPGAAQKKNEKWLREHKRYYKSKNAVESATKSRRKTKNLKEHFKID